jgi:outer membrane receptor protein involved in Fe transport
MRTLLVCLLLSAGVELSAQSNPAATSAQTPQPPAGESAPQGPGSFNETVVVTATKTEKALRDVPATVNVVSEEEMILKGTIAIENS